MTPRQDRPKSSFEEISKLVGAEIRKSTDKYDDYIDIPGKGVTMRVRWKFEQVIGPLITFYKTPAQGRRPKEIGLGWFVKFKNGDADDMKKVESGTPLLLIEITKKYALGYLLGQEKDFDKIEEYANRISAEKLKPDPNIKPVKWIRAEWIP